MPFPTDFISPQHIVVASNLTDGEVLVPYVVAQARASNATVTLVHAAGNSGIRLPSEDGDAVAQDAAHAERLLSGMGRTLEAEGIRCTIVVKPGLAGATIRQEIERVGAGRLIIGAHSYRPCGPTMIGGVANALLEYCSVPICVIGPMMMNACSGHTSPHRILHPVAASGIYRERARFAADIAQACGAELTLLHVMPPSNTASLYAHDIEKRTLRELESLALPPDLGVRVVMRYGERLAEILACAGTEGMDLIVMGMSHEYHWWSMQSNLAYQGIAESPCPVLTFRDRILTQVDSRSKLAA